MEIALPKGTPEGAQLIAAECVTLAETKDHLNWKLIGEIASKMKGERGKALKAAFEEVEEDEDEHLYHSTGGGSSGSSLSACLPFFLHRREKGT